MHLKEKPITEPMIFNEAKSFYDEMKVTDKCTFSENSNKTGILYKLNIAVHAHNHFCRGKAVSVTYSGCISVTLVLLDSVHAHIQSSVACLAAFCNFGNAPKQLLVRTGVLSNNSECLRVQHLSGPVGARLISF
jgi:hypothetical protein